MRTLHEQALLWGFDLEKCLLPIGQCDQLMFNDLLAFPINNTMIDAKGKRISSTIQKYWVSVYNTEVDTLLITIENYIENDVLCSSVYTISKKLDGEYFILVNHKNRNRVEDEYVETFTWSDTKGKLKEIIT